MQDARAAASRFGPAAVFAMTLAAPFLAPSAARADPGAVCAKRSEVVARLREGYGETRRAYGLERADAMYEVFASDGAGTWTIIVSSPDGVSCLVASGRNWSHASEALPVAEEKT